MTQFAHVPPFMAFVIIENVTWFFFSNLSKPLWFTSLTPSDLPNTYWAVPEIRLKSGFCFYQVTLDSLIPPRMLFVKASDIFHHWTIGDQRMGLAFHGTVDARSFDRGIRVALENLEKGKLSYWVLLKVTKWIFAVRRTHFKPFRYGWDATDW